jgi:outer membrane protein OmpA-like peptidoglycan-associated protein/tetratricopeptide (TPR) repeat protein
VAKSQAPIESLNPKQKKLYQKGKLLANKGNFTKSNVVFAKLIESKPDFTEALVRMGSNYYSLKNYVEAEKYFKEAIAKDPNFDPEIYFSLGQILMDQKKYREAAIAWSQYAKSAKTNESKIEKAIYNAENCNFIDNALANPQIFEPINLGKGVNSPLSEYLPQISLDGTSLVYTRRDNDENFYTSTATNDIFGSSMELRGLNTNQNEGAHSLSADGRYFVFTACDRFDAFGGCDLYFSFFEDGRWTPAKNMGHIVNSAGWDAQPALSPDGKTLYFASNRIGSLGSSDIWMTKRNNKGQWMIPVNLGPNVNTKYSEATPFLHPDGVTLYFTSDGWPGMGKSDIFYTERSFNNWEKPTNLGYPINTEGVEGGLCVSLDGKTAYFSSNYDFQNKKSLSHQDIFRFEIPENVRPKKATYVKGFVKDAKTNKPISASVLLVNLNSKDTIFETNTSTDGYFITSLPLGQYAIVATRSGYVYYSEHFESSAEDIRKPATLDIFLEPIELSQKKEKPTILNNIFFDTGSDKLLPASDTEIELIATMLSDHPRIRIRIIGHTDDVGSEDDNLDLSKRRAQSVAKAIGSRGNFEGRIESLGLGESMPIAPNDTEEGKQKNRRTEFLIF